MARSVEFRIMQGYSLNQATGCWEWTQGKSDGGYGRVMVNRKRWLVHRLAAVLWLDFDDNPAKFVCHRCDNPCCFNPEHLFIGTPQDNTDDMVAKGRRNVPHNWNPYAKAKLTPDQIREIRAIGYSEGSRSVAKRYGVTFQAISLIRRGKVFADLPESGDTYV